MVAGRAPRRPCTSRSTDGQESQTERRPRSFRSGAAPVVLGLCRPLRLGSFLLLLVHLGLLLVGLGLGARLGLLALLGALVGLRLTLGLQRVVVRDVADDLLAFALQLFHNAHGGCSSSVSSRRAGVAWSLGQTLARCAARSLASSDWAWAL